MPTIKDVARHAGVSVTTVSRVINSHPYVQPDLREHVLRSIEALGYRTNMLARGIRQGSTQSLGFIVRDMRSANFSQICSAAEEMAERHGYELFVCNSNRDPAKERRYIGSLIDRQVDGLILFTADDRVNNLDLVNTTAVPVALVSSNLPHEGVDRVASNDLQAAKDATRYLLGLGHQRIGYIGWGLQVPGSQDRLNGYLQAYSEAGIAPDVRMYRTCGTTPDNSQREVNFMLALANPPTALIVAATDLVSGALAAVYESNISIPGELSLLAFDDREITQLHRPPITVMARDIGARGAEAVKLVLSRVKGDLPREPQIVTVPFSLLTRASTTAPGPIQI